MQRRSKQCEVFVPCVPAARRRGRRRGTAALLLAVVWAVWVSAVAHGETVVESALIQLVEQVDVPARTAGVLGSVDVTEGTLVEPGALLGQIDDRQAQMQHRRAALELELSKENAKNDVKIRSAQRELDFARAELTRLERAAAGLPGSISQSQIEESKLRVSKAEFELEGARHESRLNKLTEQLKQQELELGKYEIEVRRISAPVPGIVVDVLRHAGEWVEPGDKVVRIVRIDRLRAEGLIHHEQVPANWRGLPATVSVETAGQPARQIAGQVVFVSPEVNPVNGLVRISVEFDNRHSALKPGQRARITLGAPAGGLPPARVSDAGK